MATFKANLDLMSEESVERRVAEQIVTASPLMEILPMKAVDGNRYNYKRESALVAGAVIEPGDSYTPGNSDYTEIKDDFREYLAVAAIPEAFLNGPTAVAQINSAAKVAARTFQTNFITGDSAVGKQINGLEKLCVASQLIDNNDSALSKSVLRELVRLVGIYNTPSFIMASSRGVNKIKELLDASGGTDAAMAQLPAFGNPILTFDGVPVIGNDFIPEETATNPRTTASATPTDNATVVAVTAVTGITVGRKIRFGTKATVYTVTAINALNLTVSPNVGSGVNKPASGDNLFFADLSSLYAAYFSEDDGLTAWYPRELGMVRRRIVPVPDATKINYGVVLNAGISLHSTLALSRVSKVTIV